MDLITVDQLNEFVGDTSVSTVKMDIVAAASEIVQDFLGYNPTSSERIYRFIGMDNDTIVLPIPGASAITSIYLDDELRAATDYELDTNLNMVRCLSGFYFIRDKEVKIIYTAGFATIPSHITHAAERIAGLMWSEAQGNIGLTSKSFADMSRNFVSYTNYDKYLKPLSSLRKGEL